MNTSRKKRTSKAIALIASLTLIFGLLPLTALAANGDERVTVPLKAGSSQSNSEQEQTVPHDPYDHAKFSRVTQEYGSNTVYIQCEWEQQSSTGDTQTCQFHEWPLLVLDRSDDYYDGTPKEAKFYVRLMKDYPNGKTTQGFPSDFAEWDGTFTYTGINGTVEYGPTDKAPIGEGTYYVYATVRIPSAATMVSDGTFILGTTFTIEPSAYDVTFDANVPNNASTKGQLEGAMPELHFNSRVDTRGLPPNQFKLPGYTFDSWNTKPDGKGKQYKNGESVKGLSYGGEDVTLFAQWKPKEYTITYESGDANVGSYEETAVFDVPGKLKAIADLRWTYDNHGFLGWITESIALLFADQEDYVNLGGQPDGYYKDPPNVELIAQWVESGQIIAAVTKNGVPQGDLESGFSLVSDNGTVFTMPTTYEDGKYVFDPTKAVSHGSSISSQLPPGRYDLYLGIESIPGSPGYPETSAHIMYGADSATSVVFDYYTVNMVKDPAFKDACDIVMDPISSASMYDLPGAFCANALEGAELKLTTTTNSGYHFDGYSATGVTPAWKDNDPMKAEQIITVKGQADIVAHVAANTYKVQFDANTNAAVIGTMEDQDMVYGEPQNLFANNFVCGGAVFTGWNTKADGTGTAYEDGQSVKNLTTENGGAITLYAQWEETPAKSALLTFDLAGGTLDGKTGSITVSVNVGDEIKIPAAPTREGSAFKYWKGSEYQPGDKYTVEGDHTFTAVWEETPAPVKKATLTFDLAGGTLDGKTGTVTVEANVGDTIKLPGAPTKKGYAFKFWKGSEYAARAEYKVEGDHAFAAEWAAFHTVTFDANGHGKAPDAQEVEHGEKAKKPANPTADGYTFGGWYKDKACKQAYDFSAPVTEDVTLYAKWTKKTSSSSGTSPKTGDPLAGAFAIALALAAASALALAFSRRRSRG